MLEEFDQQDEVEVEETEDSELEASEEYDDDAAVEDDSSDEEDFDLGVDVSELPDELQAVHKQMLKGMNAKFREWSEKSKSAEQKAAAFEQLLQDPQKRRVFLASMQAMDADGSANGNAATEKKSYGFNPHPDLDVDSAFDEETKPALEAMMGRFIEERLMPAMKPYMDFIHSQANSASENEWKTLEEQYPGASEHREAAEKLARVSGISKKQALLAVTEGSILQAKAPSKNGKPKPKKAIGLTKQTSVPASRVAPPKGNGQSLEDFTREEMKKLGIKW